MTTNVEVNMKQLF